LAWEIPGNGSVANPWNISDCYELQGMENDLDGNFQLVSDIDCSMTNPSDADFSSTGAWYDGKGWDPVGDDTTQFTGNFDGNNFTISNLNINRGGETYVGLFGYTNGTTITNLGLTEVNLSLGDASGSLVGYFDGPLIDKVFVNGSVSGNNDLGGIVGSFNGDGNITNSYFSGSVNSVDTGVSGLIGGFYTGKIINCYSKGNITGGDYTGGLVGYSGFASNEVINSFTTANISSASSFKGGLSGEVITSTNSYWFNYSDDVDSCYFDGNTGCSAKTDLDYFQGDVSGKAPFWNWSFFSVWHEVIGGYPVLAWQGTGDSGGPVITIFNVEDSTAITRTVTYNVSDDSSVLNCSVYLDGVVDSWNTSVVNVSINNTFSLTDLSVGAHTAIVSCYDVLGNQGNSSSDSFIVSAAAEDTDTSGSTGGSADVGSTELGNIDSIKEQVISYGSRYYFKVTGSEERHRIELNHIYRNNNTVDFKISSETQIVNIALDEKKPVDLDSDGTYDFVLELTAISSSSLTVEVKLRPYIVDSSGDLIDDQNDDGVINQTDVDALDEDSFSYGLIGWLVAFVVVLILLIWLIIYFVKNSKKLDLGVFD
jgi:hypothetical protein